MSTRLENLLAVLAGGAWKSNTELVKAGVGFRYGSIVETARKAGYNIESKYVSARHWDYRLKPGQYVQPKKERCRECGQILKHK